MKSQKARRIKPSKRRKPSGTKSRGLCEKSGKPKYTKVQAQRIALKKSAKHAAAFRPYRCNLCPWWHLTTQAKRAE